MHERKKIEAGIDNPEGVHQADQKQPAAKKPF